MVVDEPVTELTLGRVLERPIDEIVEALARLEGACGEHGFELRRSTGMAFLQSG